MKRKIFLYLVVFFSYSATVFSQASITNATPTCTIDFSSTMQTSVGSNPSTAFSGAGFAPNPTYSGRLNSNAWEVKGWSYGDLLFGSTQTLDDFGRGSVSGAVLTSGMYAFTEYPGTVANPSLMIQPGSPDFAPGTVTLKIKNNGTTNITQIAVSYNILVRNDEDRSTSFNFSHSLDNITFIPVPALDYITPDVQDALQWGIVGGIGPSRSTTITGLNIAPNGVYYIRWYSNDVGGVGNRDEIGLDDIVLTGYYGPPAPAINLVGNTLTILNGDVTPTVAKGTNFGIQNPPASFGVPTPGASSQTINYTIQNLGGAPLTITSILLSGPNVPDFYLLGSSITLPKVIPSLGNTTFSLVFNPSIVGTEYATVTILNNDINRPNYTFNIQGDGYIPVPEIGMRQNAPGLLTTIVSGSTVASSLNNTLFVSQVVGNPNPVTSKNQFKITNEAASGVGGQLLLTGPSPYVTIGGVNPSDFTLTIIPAQNYMNPGYSRFFEIKFNPSAVGVRTAIVSIANNDSDENPYTFLIQGSGTTPEIDITGNSQPIVSGTLTTTVANNTYFDNVNVTSGFMDRVFTIQNNGSSILTIGTLTIIGLNASDFTIQSLPASTLAVGASTTFIIRFDPSSIGLRSASISLINDDSNENPYTFAIGGYGVNFTPCSLSAVQTIAIQDFEPSPATPVWNFTTTSGFFLKTGGTGYGVALDGGLSPKFIGTTSYQVSNSSTVLTMANIDTSLYTNIDFSLRLSALSTTINEGLDASPDKVLISVSTDNGATWYNEMQVTGNNNSLWTFTSGVGTAAKIYSGNNLISTFSPFSAPAIVNYQTISGFSTMILSSLPAVTNLSIRITIANGINEIWSLDNITLTGKKESATTWNGTTWSNGAPVGNVKAIIDGNYNTGTNGNVAACKCDIKTGRNINIVSNGFFSIESDFNNKGNVTIEDGGSLLQRDDLAVDNGSVLVKRNTTPMVLFDYTYWSSPVTNQTLIGMSPSTSLNKFWSFSPTIGNWINASSTDVMLPGKGYIVRAPQGYSNSTAAIYAAPFTGTPNNGSILTPIIVASSDYNLIGNPYPSAINADLFLSFPSNIPVVDGTIYFWTHNTPMTNTIYTANDYASYNLVGGVGTAASAGVLGNITPPNGKIASGQGFFIKGLVTGQATFNNSMREQQNNLMFFKSSQTSTIATELEKHRYWLNLSNNQGAFKQTLVGYVQGATNNIDRNFDGESFDGQNIISFYSICNAKNLVIQGRELPFNENDIVPLGYSSTISGDFQIGLQNFDGIFSDVQNIYLEDKLLNIIFDIKQMPYTFSTAIGTFDDRFQIRYTNTTLANHSFDWKENNIIVASKDRKINIISQFQIINEITIFDVLGRKILQENNLYKNSFSATNVISSNQTLIIKIKLENGITVTKKIVYQ